MDPFALVLRPNELGDLADVSPFVRNTWESLRILRWKAVRYYSGQIFMEPVAQEVGEAMKLARKADLAGDKAGCEKALAQAKNVMGY